MKKIDELMQELESKKQEMRSFLDSNDLEKAKTTKEEIRLLKEKIEMEKELEEEEKREVENKIETGKDVKDMDKRDNVKDIEYRAIGKFLLKKELTEEERASINVGNSGAILPQGFVNQVQVLTKGFPALKKYTHVIPVTTNTGKMPISSGSQTKKLAKLAVDTEMVKEMCSTTPVEYAVEDYGKIIPTENSVLEDTGIDFYNSIIAPSFAEDSVNTENEEILSVVTANATAFTATDYTGISKCLNTKIAPALLKSTVIVTNQTSYDYLDTNAVDANGRPLLVDSLAVEGGKVFKGREIVVLDDADLVSPANKVTFYVVNLYALVKFFDRKGYEIATSTEAGFTFNQTFVRVLERFDIVKGDARACYKVEFAIV